MDDDPGSREELLRKSGFLDAILEETEDAILIKDRQGRYLLVNTIGARNFGFTPEQMIGKTNAELSIPPAVAQEIDKADLKVMTSGEVVSYEISPIVNGQKRYFLTTKSPYLDKKKNIIGVIGISRDITERKLIEEKLRMEHAYRKPIEDAMLAGVAAADLKGEIIYVNQAFCNMVGREERELIGVNPPHPFWAPEESDAIMSDFLKRRSTLQQSSETEYRFLRRNGERFPVLVKSALLTDGHGRNIGFVSTFTDITERKRAEERLIETNRLLETIFQVAPIGITILDQKGRVELWSPGAERIFGWKSGEVIGKIYPAVTNDKKEEFLALLRSVLEGGEISGFDTVRRKKGGALIEVSIWIVPLKDAVEPRCLGIVADVSDKRKMEEELKKVQKLESLGILAGGIAHDFNNILTGIIGNITLAKMNLSPDDPRFQRLSDAERASARATHLANQLLTFAKGGAPMKKTVSIRKLLEQTVPFSLMGSDIRCEFEVSESLWNVDADESQMNQVIQNIIINAKQAMPEGGSVGVSAENIVIERDLIEKAPMKKGRYVKISIRDSGIGISKNLLAKIFDPYFTTKETGSGLGLAITHSIVQKHGGSIAVESRQGQGTTFHIYLPASFSEIPARDERPVNWVRGNGKILVIDDEGAILQVTAEMLTRLGFESKAVRTGSEAIEIFRESEESGSPFDLVITDLTIPGDIGGIGILQKIRQINPEAKVIVTSGYSNDPVLSDYQGKGFSFFIAKPFTLSDISDAIKRLLPGP